MISNIAQNAPVSEKLPANGNNAETAKETGASQSFATLLSAQMAAGATASFSGASFAATEAAVNAQDVLETEITDKIEENAQTGQSLFGGILGEGTDLSETLLLLCMMMSSNSSESGGMSGAMGAMLLSLAGAISKKNNAETEKMRYDLLTSGYKNTMLENINDSLFSTTSEVNFPYRAGKAVTPIVESSEEDRSAQAYRDVIDQFTVESNPRYKVNKKGEGDTYCNIFLWDVTSAMNAEIPHYVDPETNEPMQYPNVDGAKHMNANRIYDWLRDYGQEYGWREVSAEEAQTMANQGQPAVTIWKNPTGGHGHCQVVSPSLDGQYDEGKGVMIAQAGRNLYSYAPITKVYSKLLTDVKYYAHA